MVIPLDGHDKVNVFRVMVYDLSHILYGNGDDVGYLSIIRGTVRVDEAVPCGAGLFRSS